MSKITYDHEEDPTATHNDTNTSLDAWADASGPSLPLVDTVDVSNPT